MQTANTLDSTIILDISNYMMVQDRVLFNNTIFNDSAVTCVLIPEFISQFPNVKSITYEGMRNTYSIQLNKRRVAAFKGLTPEEMVNSMFKDALTYVLFSCGYAPMLITKKINEGYTYQDAYYSIMRYMENPSLLHIMYKVFNFDNQNIYVQCG